MTFSPDGKHLAFGCGGEIWIWDVATEQPLLVVDGQVNRVTCLEYSPNGRYLVSGGTGPSIHVWDAEKAESRQMQGWHDHWVNAVAFSPDGQNLASASHDKTVRIWNVARGELLLILEGHEDWVNAVAFAPDGQSLASGSRDETVRVWDTASGRLRMTYKGHITEVTSIAFAPDGRYLLSAAKDGTVRVWDIGAGGLPALTLHSSEVSMVRRSDDGQFILSHFTRHVGYNRESSAVTWLWDAATGRPLLRAQAEDDGISEAARSPDGRHIATIGSTGVSIWDAATGQLVLRWQARLRGPIAYAPDGQKLATGMQDGTQIWDAASGLLLRTLGQYEHGGVVAINFSPEGRQIASASCDAVRVWEVASGQISLVLAHAMVTRVSYSLDGSRILTNCFHNILKVWDTTTGRCLEEIREVSKSSPPGNPRRVSLPACSTRCRHSHRMPRYGPACRLVAGVIDMGGSPFKTNLGGADHQLMRRSFQRRGRRPDRRAMSIAAFKSQALPWQNLSVAERNPNWILERYRPGPPT